MTSLPTAGSRHVLLVPWDDVVYGLAFYSDSAALRCAPCSRVAVSCNDPRRPDYTDRIAAGARVVSFRFGHGPGSADIRVAAATLLTMLDSGRVQTHRVEAATLLNRGGERLLGLTLKPVAGSEA